MAKGRLSIALTCLLVFAVTAALGEALNTTWTLVGYNNLGMHCMDSDYAVFSILPPYNTIHAQLTDPSGTLIRDPASGGITVTYQAVLDGSGSINTTSQNKTNFWSFVFELFGAAVPVDQGLAANPMPGTANTPAGAASGRRARTCGPTCPTPLLIPRGCSGSWSSERTVRAPRARGGRPLTASSEAEQIQGGSAA